MALVERLAEAMNAQGLSLGEAVSVVATTGSSTAASIKEGRVDWSVVAEKFGRELIESGTVTEQTYRRMGGLYVSRVVELLQSSSPPKDGRSTLSSLVENFPLTPGGSGRKSMVSYAARFLKYGIERCGATERFKPPEDKKIYIGQSQTQKSTGTPLLDKQFLELFDAISNPRWKLAVGLAGVFGLRPVEIGNCQPEGQGLRVKGIKRNRSGKAKDRLIHPLDPDGGTGLAYELLEELKAGGREALPACEKSWSINLNHHLTNHVPVWEELQKKSEKSGQGHLVPYSLRHGFAWRGSQLYGLSPRVLSALMGHTVAVHLKHYGQWANEAETALAVKLAVERVQAEFKRQI
jgi:integrase